MSTEISTFDRIVKWAKVINEKPNFNCTHFYLSDNEKAMIIDLSRMAEMPPVLKKLKEKEKAYLFIDLDNSKFVRYYAHDIKTGTYMFINEVEGEIMFSLVEGDILSYIEDNILDLTKHNTPITRFMELNPKNSDKTNPLRSNPLPQQQSTYNYGSHYSRTSQGTQYGPHMGGTPYQHAAWAVAESRPFVSTFKEREQFIESIYSFVKQGKTGSAIDLIHEFISNKKSDKECLNNIFRFISIEKIDFFTLRELLITTESLKDELNERPGILAKYKAMASKTKPKKANHLINEVENNARSLS